MIPVTRLNGLILIFLFNLAVNTGTAQVASLNGVIVDEDSKTPIPFASVFFASTTIGTTAKEDGSFTLPNIPDGKYDVIVSSVGYKSYSYAIEFKGQPITITFEIKPQVTQLSEVVVQAGTNVYYQTFLDYFLGTTPNAIHCKVKNPEVLNFSYDQEKNILRVNASAPIEVENHALGYRVFYHLDEFTLDQTTNSFRVFGIPQFEMLVAENEKQAKQWNRARYSAYQGSVQHLMKSLVQRNLRKENFILRKQNTAAALNEKLLFPDPAKDEIVFKGKLEVIFEGEYASQEYLNQFRIPRFDRSSQNSQVSSITFTEPKISLFKNGYYENRKSLELEGYMAWTEFIAELVPLEYEPNQKKKGDR